MRKTRIGALVASTALASATVLTGAGAANASVDDIIGNLDVGGSLQADADEPGEPAQVDTDTVTSDGNYTMTATAFDNCTVEFTLENDRDGNANWRADFQIGDEAPVTENLGLRGETRDDGPVYRTVLGSNEQMIEDIQNARGDNMYDIAAINDTVDLTQSRTVVDADDPNQGDVWELAGVQPNENGEHNVSFGVWQGPASSGNADVYNIDGEVTVTGCPTTEDDEDDSGPLGSLDVFGSLSS